MCYFYSLTDNKAAWRKVCLVREAGLTPVPLAPPFFPTRTASLEVDAPGSAPQHPTLAIWSSKQRGHPLWTSVPLSNGGANDNNFLTECIRDKWVAHMSHAEQCPAPRLCSLSFGYAPPHPTMLYFIRSQQSHVSVCTPNVHMRTQLSCLRERWYSGSNSIYKK